MKFCRLFVVMVAIAIPSSSARCASHNGDHLPTGGREYVRLTDCAAANDLRLRWIQHNKIAQLSNQTAKFTFTVDSREAQVNGVGVWLSFPVSIHEGAPCIARLDVQTVVQPLLTPPKNTAGGSLRSICLDPGHGGKDPGNRVGHYEEKRYTLLLAQEVGRQLDRAGLNVKLTRSSDSTVELPARPEVAKSAKADLFVSLHFNSVASSRTVVRGAEVYCLTPAGASSTNARGEPGNTSPCAGNRFNNKNVFLAYEMQKALTRNLTVDDRGVRRARFAVLRDATMPAVLIEAGYMSHPEEGKRIFDAAYRREMARAIVDGLLAYKRVVDRAG